MNLPHHAAILWRHRLIFACGLLIAVVLGTLSSYSVSLAGGPSLVPRGEETWSSDATLLVTQPGFPEGRTTLPEKAVDAPLSIPSSPDPGTGTTTPERGRVTFADPGRLSALASLYAQLVVSDDVRRRLPGDPSPTQITVQPLEGTGGLQLPVLKLTATSDSAPAAKLLNRRVGESLREVLTSRQTQTGIAASERVRISQLNAPSEPILVAGRSQVGSILAFLLCLVGTVAFIHILAGLRARRETDAPVTKAIDPWEIEPREFLDRPERPVEAQRSSR